MGIENQYFDKNGKRIKEFAVLKIFHFTGKRKKKYYMYKWVKLVEWEGVQYWAAFHLNNNSGEYFHLRTIADNMRVIPECEVVQEPYSN